MSLIKDRIIELRRVKASSLRANPKNWRTHPREQRAALAGMLREVGFADAVLAREDGPDLILIDGHLRTEVADDQVVPVLVLDVNEAEADKLLATLDPLAAMAQADQKKLDELIGGIDAETKELEALLKALKSESAKPSTAMDSQTPSTTAVGVAGDTVKLGDAGREQGPRRIKTKAGEVWSLGQHALYCGEKNLAECDALVNHWQTITGKIAEKQSTKGNKSKSHKGTAKGKRPESAGSPALRV